MNLVDSCGWMEYFAEGPNASFYSKPIEDIEHLLVPTICVLEVFKHVLVRRGEKDALAAVMAMSQGTVVNLDIETAMTAAKIGAELRLPLADRVILATARAHAATVWTQDTHFQHMPGVKFIKKKSG